MGHRRIFTRSLSATLCLLILSQFHDTGGAPPRAPAARSEEPALIGADDANIQYTGRIDFTDPKKPKFWAPGVYVKARFKGAVCDVVVNAEQQGATNHNYIEIVVDDRKPVRLQTSRATNTIRAAEGLTDGPHTITVCKDTESGIGYLEFIGFRCEGLLPLSPKAARRLEFIGDSITCGTGSDLSKVPCEKGQWYDQQNAYLSYGPLVARELGAEWHLTAVSGIGLLHSCCEMTITAPEVFDKINLRGNAGAWDFRRYQPDAVTICLGQNDGTDGPAAFRDAYVAFIQRIRSRYPRAQIICLTSPMAESSLNAVLKENLRQVVQLVNKLGDRKVQGFFFYKNYRDGCGGHPDLDQHQLIANELSGYLRSVLGW